MLKYIFLSIPFVLFSPITSLADTTKQNEDNMDSSAMKNILLSFQKREQLLFFEQDRFFVSYTRTKGYSFLKNNSMPQVRYINARLGDIWLVESFLVNKNEENQTEKIQYYAKKGVIWEWREFSNSAVIVPYEDGRNIYQEWHYSHNDGIVPYRAIAENNNRLFSEILEEVKTESYLYPLDNELLPYCIENNWDQYSIREKIEEVEGARCIVLERIGFDTIWVDPALNFAIRKRVLYWGKDEPIKFEILNRHFKEIQPNLYMPMEQEVIEYIGKTMELQASLLGKPLYHFIYSVDDIQIGRLNDAARSKLELKPSVGTSVLDVRTESRYVISDPNSDPFAGPIAQGIKVNRYAMFRAILIIAGSVMIFISIWLKLRNRQV
jgi:hypothetical protein